MKLALMLLLAMRTYHWSWLFVAISSALLMVYGIVLAMKGFADDPSGMMLLKGGIFSVVGWVIALVALVLWYG